MDCLILLSLVSDLSQKHEHKKSLIIPGEQGRDGGMMQSDMIEKKKAD